MPSRFRLHDSDAESIRKEVEERLPRGPAVSTSTDLPLTDDCKRILAFAAEEAERLAHRHIGTEHLLLGILREEKCVAAEILTGHGLRLETVREELSKAKGTASSFRMDASPPPTVSHDDPMVPDGITASRIAVAIWFPVYGAETIARQRPVIANLERFRVWRVSAGSLFAFIRLKDGEVLSMGQSEGTDV
jgi:hypothetical protein